ncbi:hypothetical protein [Streptomyces sp. NBC_01304]|uniref:hypothetical protein n=1 Tax=Streptomyces sp. NBC_01304 TaxID=2903818 RepID=UPI002E0D7C5B|nr:hypothetical protein OG430_44520 [Streptomyces sp. NBC_01304]
MTIPKPDGRPLRLGGLSEAAKVLDLTKQAAARALRRPGAPAPLETLDMGPVYDLDDIEEWDMTRKKTPGPKSLHDVLEDLNETTDRATTAVKKLTETLDQDGRNAQAKSRAKTD